jgi:hypothetical protein
MAFVGLVRRIYRVFLPARNRKKAVSDQKEKIMAIGFGKNFFWFARSR